jgi:hypothetical protein
VWKRYLASWDVEDTLEDFLANRERLIVLRLEPQSEQPLPKQKPDLAWIWPAVAGATLAAWLVARPRNRNTLRSRA